MSYQRGIIIQEEATALTPMSVVSAPCVAIGTASKGETNQPILIQNMTEFTSAFGFTGDYDTATLEEVADVYFNLYNVKPVIFIRVVASGTTVTNANVIAAIEAVEQVYPKLGMIPGTLIAPKFSAIPAIALKLAATAKNINGVFKTFALADITLPTALLAKENPTADRALDDKAIARGNLLGDDAASDANYTLVKDYKDNNALNDEYMAVCWPRVGLGEKTYWLSTQMAALMDYVDTTNGQIPFESPSNKGLRADKSLVKSGASVYLSYAHATTLNSQGIVTALNWNGWRLFGNRTATYPTNDDPKDSFIPCRRMMNFVANALAINYFSRIDNPMNKRLVDTVLDEVNLFLNGLTNQGAILGGRCAFLEEDNLVTDLADGKMKFRLYVAPPPPAESITFVVAYDVSYLSALFSA